MNNEHEHQNIQTSEKRETRIWGASMIIFLLLQTGGAIWWASSINGQVNQNITDINEIKGTTAIYLDRQQIDDLLGARDQRLENIEASLRRIENKI